MPGNGMEEGREGGREEWMGKKEERGVKGVREKG